MKFSLNWIREYVDLPQDLTVEQLAHDLTMRTVEVEAVLNLAEGLEKVVIGRIAAVLPHPNADKLKICQVDVGQNEPLTIVCGGSNLYENQLVAVALPEARVNWHGAGEPVEIKVTKLRGVQSFGMICAAEEIGLHELFLPKNEHEILDLTDFTAKPGDPVADVLSLNDEILEIDNKSMTNRPDLWGHYGIARELSAIYHQPLRPLPAFKIPSNIGSFPVFIDAPNLCNRYAAVVYSNLKTEPSPYWLQLMLWKVGMRPINNLVDITNYVMLATGQPTHGFDKDHVDSEIRVRTARPGEKLEMLDGKLLHLSPEDLMICDAKKPMSLAGIMGGKSDSILPDTKEMILELAKFDPITIRRSAQRHNLRTEAGIRNEKGIDAERMDQAMGLADDLIRKIIPKARLAAFTDCWPVRVTYPQIDISMRFLNVRLGRTLSVNEVISLLEPLGFKITKKTDDQVLIQVPSWRGTGDVSLPDDILEEVARMIGYEQFPFVPPVITLDRAVLQRVAETERAIREYLAFRAGFQEVFTYPWIDEAMILAAGLDPANCLKLATPPSPETANLRASLIPGLLEATARNLRYYEEFKIFELAQVFRPGETHPSDPEETLPIQLRFLSGALTGENPVRLFRELKGVLELMPRVVQIESYAFAHIKQPPWADKKVWLNIVSDGKIIGSLGLLSKKAAYLSDIKRAQVALFELNLEEIKPLPSRENKYHPLPQFPLVKQDLSIIVDTQVTWEEIENIVSDFVRDIIFIDEYKGKQVPPGKKSISFRVFLGSDQGTLTAAEIEAEMQDILDKIHRELGGEIRRADYNN